MGSQGGPPVPGGQRSTPSRIGGYSPCTIGQRVPRTAGPCPEPPLPGTHRSRSRLPAPLPPPSGLALSVSLPPPPPFPPPLSHAVIVVVVGPHFLVALCPTLTLDLALVPAPDPPLPVGLPLGPRSPLLAASTPRTPPDPPAGDPRSNGSHMWVRRGGRSPPPALCTVLVLGPRTWAAGGSHTGAAGSPSAPSLPPCLDPARGLSATMPSLYRPPAASPPRAVPPSCARYTR